MWRAVLPPSRMLAALREELSPRMAAARVASKAAAVAHTLPIQAADTAPMEAALRKHLPPHSQLCHSHPHS